MKANSESTTSIVNTLETMLVDRTLGIYGDLYGIEGVTLKRESDEKSYTGGKVVDVRDDAVEGVVIAVKDKDSIKYVSLRSIEAFSF